jgi:hypothetical protein
LLTTVRVLIHGAKLLFLYTDQPHLSLLVFNHDHTLVNELNPQDSHQSSIYLIFKKLYKQREDSPC